MKPWIAALLLIVSYWACASEKSVSPRSTSISISETAPTSLSASSVALGRRRRSTSFSIGKCPSFLVDACGGSSVREKVVDAQHLPVSPVHELRAGSEVRRSSELFNNNPLWEIWCQSNGLDRKKRAQIELTLVSLMKSKPRGVAIGNLKSRLQALQTVTRCSRAESKRVEEVQSRELGVIMTQLLIDQNNNLEQLVQGAEADSRNAQWRFKATFGLTILMAVWAIGSTVAVAS